MARSSSNGMMSGVKRSGMLAGLGCTLLVLVVGAALGIAAFAMLVEHQVGLRHSQL